MLSQEDRGARPAVRPIDLVALHVKIGALSFGGGMTGLVHHEVVTKRRWMTSGEFLGGLALCQILPGGNVVNLAVYVGHSMRGTTGAALALAGLLAAPFFIVIGAVQVYDRIAGLAWVSAALHGVTMAAIGLLLMVVARGARASRDIGSLVLMAGIAVAVGLLHVPLVAVVCIGAPLGIALAAYRKSAHV